MVNGKIVSLILFLLLASLQYSAHAQEDTARDTPSEDRPYPAVTRILFKSQEIEIIYTLERGDDMDRKIINIGYSVLNDSINKIAKMRIEGKRGSSITIPTIPIDDIVIDDKKRIILCLSRATTSVYNIVIYDFDGKLLFKKHITLLEIVLDPSEYGQFKTKYPYFLKDKLEKEEVYLENGLYYISVGNWNFLSAEEKKEINGKKWCKVSHYFPFISPESSDGNPSYVLQKYSGFYSMTDPFYEYEVAPSGQITGIILNDEFDGKVKIPVTLSR